MRPDEIKDGWLYAVTTRLLWFEPHLAILTENGIRFVHANKFDISIDTDGLHHVSDEFRKWASIHGLEFDDHNIFSLWSLRLGSEQLTKLDLDKNFWTEPIDEEDVEWLNSDTGPGQLLSHWLRSSSDWQGSSASVLYKDNGELAGAFVTLFTANPYRLMTLLRWLGVPVNIINPVTGIEENL
jgi:hypothetical protein